MSKEEILERLRKGLMEYNVEAVEKGAKEAIEAGIDPLEAIDVLTRTMRELGEKFAKVEIFLPELMMAVDAMKAGIAVLEPKLPKAKKEVKVPRNSCDRHCCWRHTRHRKDDRGYDAYSSGLQGNRSWQRRPGISFCRGSEKA